MNSVAIFTFISALGHIFTGCSFTTSKYGSTENPMLGIEDDAGVVAICSIRTPDKLPENHIAIYDDNENMGMVKFLSDTGILRDTGNVVDLEWTKARICELTDKGKLLFN